VPFERERCSHEAPAAAVPVDTRERSDVGEAQAALACPALAPAAAQQHAVLGAPVPPTPPPSSLLRDSDQEAARTVPSSSRAQRGEALAPSQDAVTAALRALSRARA